MAGWLVAAGNGHALAQTGEADTQTDDAVAACNDAAGFAQTGDIESAVEEARWCLDVLEQIQQDTAYAVFPEFMHGVTRSRR